MKKRLLSVFLCLCMVFGLVPATVWAETTNGHTHYLCGGSTCNGSGHENETYKTTFEKEIKQEGNTLKIGDKSWAPTKGSNDTFYILPTGTYYLGSDISPEYTIKIENNVTLCLNGHKITAADGMDAIYMTGGSFTLTDCKGVGTITHASSKTGRGVYVSSGTFNMYGGSITGNKAQDAQGRGGGVYVYSGSGTFNMYGGSITGNRATGDGGGVYKSGSNSSFNMYGGSITGNTANSYGGGVYVDGGGFTMSGGTIGGTKTGETNTATYGGGGVYAKANFEMTGGSITGNETNRGGGVYVTGKGSFTMSASADGQNIPSITGNNATENGGGVYVVGSSSTFKMTGGSIGGTNENDANTATNGGSVCVDCGKFTMSASADGQNIPSITGNNATKNGGGVYVIGSSSTFKMTGGTIGGTDANDANTATNGGGVCVSKNGSFEMSGSSCITNNKADSYGGGVHISYASATFTMKGGSITGNNAYKSDYISTFGGGVCVGNGTFTMTDGSITGNNAAYGGGVYTANEFKMSGGSITGNNAYKSDYTSTFGGGVCVGNGIFTVSGEVTVTDNTKGGTKGADGKFTGDTKNNVYLPTGKTITIGTDKLSEGAQLGMTLDEYYGDKAFTSGWNANMSGKTPTDHFTSDVDGYEAKLYDTELKLVSTHVHSWTYTANGDKITATCKNCEDNNGQNFVGGTCTITAADATYNGSVKTAVVSETGIFENVDMSISYSKYNATSKQFESINILPAGAGRYKASITYSGATAGVEYTIKKATQEAPEGLTVSPAGSIGGKGKINGTTSGTYNEVKAMEFNTSATATTGWKDCSDSSTEVAPGTYYVRYKETDNYYASAVSAALTVKEHTHFGGNATCQEKAICDGCGQEYGEFGNHKFTETVSRMYLKSASTCQSPAVYYKSCLVCDKKSSETFEYGAVDPSNHKHTEVRNAKSATCCEKGDTGDTYCTDCNALVSIGAEIPATGNHTDVDGKWESDETNHWHTCYFGTKFDLTAHSGGEATCKNQAKCSECGHSYGSLDASNHKGTTYLKNQREATCYKKGYTGDTYCSDCNEKIADGQSIAKNAHNPASVWTTDEQNHWKKCQTVGCGNVIDKAAHNGGEATCVSKAVCEVCKVHYGDIDAANHKHTEIRGAVPATEQEKGYTGDTWCLDCNKKIADGKETDRLSHSLKKVEAKAATTRENGNIEYYHCDGCDKYFADESGTKKISREETIIKKLPPKIIEGNNAIVNNGEKKSLTFRSDAAFTDFIRVELDGKVLDEKDYTKAEGSIIVTLNNDFVSTLSVGEHTLGIVSESGTATAKFTVKASEMPNESPKTGDNNMVAFWSLAAILSLAVLVFTTVTSKKKRAK